MINEDMLQLFPSQQVTSRKTPGSGDIHESPKRDSKSEASLLERYDNFGKMDNYEAFALYLYIFI